MLVLLLAACGGTSATGAEADTANTGSDAGSDTDAGQTTINVFAAASLTNVFAELVTAFEAKNPGLQVQLNLAGSSSLRSQILDGAPADVFASANSQVMAQVIEGGAISETPSVFATNRLTIAVPVDNPGEVTGLADFGRDDLFIGLCQATAPCGSLAADVLAAADVTPAVDSFEPDVRALLTKISAGELDAGLVYVTDVNTEQSVLAIEPPTMAEAETSYPIATVVGGPAGEAADRFVAFVLGPDGQETLAEFGFGAP